MSRYTVRLELTIAALRRASNKTQHGLKQSGCSATVLTCSSARISFFWRKKACISILHLDSQAASVWKASNIASPKKASVSICTDMLCLRLQLPLASNALASSMSPRSFVILVLGKGANLQCIQQRFQRSHVKGGWQILISQFKMLQRTIFQRHNFSNTIATTLKMEVPI